MEYVITLRAGYLERGLSLYSALSSHIGSLGIPDSAVEVWAVVKQVPVVSGIANG